MALRRTYARRGRKRAGINVARGTAAAILLAAVIYFAVAGGLGTWLAEHLILPFMGGEGDVPPPMATNSQAGATATPEPTPAAREHSEEIDFPATPLYAIQLGAFVNEDNARAEADRYRARGAAGFLFEDVDRVRVLAGAYLTRAEADDVRQQLLTQQGVESYVLELFADVAGVTVRVTAPESAIAALREAVEGFGETLSAIEGISRGLDTGGLTPEAAMEQIAALLPEAERHAAALAGEKIEDASRLTEQLRGAMETLQKSLTDLTNGAADAMAISSRIKYTYVESWIHYGQSLRSVAQMGGD